MSLWRCLPSTNLRYPKATFHRMACCDQKERGYKTMKNWLRLACSSCIIFGAIFLAMGCTSGLYMAGKRPPENYQKLGQAKGEACGTILIGPTAYNFIPVQLNSRVERAYQQALQSVPGSASLVNITLEEYWIWWIIGTTRCVTITGEAIK